MSRPTIDYDEIWREVSRDDFINLVPSSEYNLTSVQGLSNLILEALNILRNPNIMRNLTQAQANDLRTKVRQLKAQLTRESALARRVDPSVPLYNSRE